MTTRRAFCNCGQLQLVCTGEPVRVSMCHCLACQRRTGSVYGVQARFRREDISSIEGRFTQYVRVADSGNSVTFHFCPECGATVYWELSALPGFVSVAVGAFADPSFPAPKISIYEERRHPWALPRDLELELGLKHPLSRSGLLLLGRLEPPEGHVEQHVIEDLQPRSDDERRHQRD